MFLNRRLEDPEIDPEIHTRAMEMLQDVQVTVDLARLSFPFLKHARLPKSYYSSKPPLLVHELQLSFRVLGSRKR